MVVDEPNRSPRGAESDDARRRFAYRSDPARAVLEVRAMQISHSTVSISRSLVVAVWLIAAGAPLTGSLPAQVEQSDPRHAGDLREKPISDEIEIDPRIERAVERLERSWKLDDGENRAARERALSALVRFADGSLHPRDAQRMKLTFQKILEQYSDDLPERSVAVRHAIRGISRLGRTGIEWLIGFRDVDGIPIRPETQALRGMVLRKIAESGHERAPGIVREVIERSSERTLIAAAGVAMKEFRYLPRKRRQPLVESLARRFVGLENVASRNPGDPLRSLDLEREDAEDDLFAVYEPWSEALEALTGVDQPRGQEWWDWYQENKEESWPQDDEARRWRRRHRESADGDDARRRRRPGER